MEIPSGFLILNLNIMNNTLKPMNLVEYVEVICEFLRDTLKTTKQKGYVLGLSGGLDSAVVALLMEKANVPFKCLLMPIESNYNDLEVGLRFVKNHHFDYEISDLTLAHQAIIDTAKANNHELRKEVRGNIKARLRMSNLYAYAQQLGYLVIGTDNYDEYMLGYFTKYGDGGVDLLPIVYLLKGEVKEVGRLLGLEDEILNRKPSAGFYEGHEDESELGFSYDEADRYFLNPHDETISQTVKARIEHWINISHHKRDPLPKPIPFIRKKDE